MAGSPEQGEHKSSIITHELPTGGNLKREVRWYRESGNAYRWSNHRGDWVFLGRVSDLSYARELEQKDMLLTRSRG
jgi:hypothetical protein